MDQNQPLPPPLPNDGSLNTELPVDQPTQSKPSFNKRLGLIAGLSVVAAAGLVYLVYSFPQISSARRANIIVPSPKIHNTITPTAVITQTEEQQVDSIDLGDVDGEMKGIDADLNSL